MTELALPQIFTPDTAAEWNTALLANADVLKLRTRTWQPGGVTRTIFAVMANLYQLTDVGVSLLSQSGFLDYAATGTVTYTDPVSGEVVIAYVTPDPSDPAQNPTGELGALDVLADSVYNVQRILQTFAGGTLAIANTSASTYGAFDAGGYHVAQPDAPGSPTYSNAAGLTIAPSSTAGTAISNATNATPIAVTTSGSHALTTGDTVFIAGVLGNLAANGAFTVVVTSGTVFTLVGSAGSGGWTSGGTVYIPTTAEFIADVAGTTSNAEDPNVVTQPVTSLVGILIGNVAAWLGSDTESNVALADRCRLKLQSLSPNGPRGAYEYFAKSAQQLAPLLSPSQIVTSAITRVLVQADATTGSVTTTIANASGAPGAGDVTAVDAVLQAYCVPLGVTATTQAAAELSLPVTAKAWVPAAYASTSSPTSATIELATEIFFMLLALGGVSDPTGTAPNTNVVPFDALVGAIFTACAAAKIPLQDLDVTIDGGTSNVQLALTPVPEVAVLASVAVTTVGV